MTEMDTKLGWLLAGGLTSIFFFGFNSYQTVGYFRSYHKDPWPQKIFVAFIWLLELAHGILAGYMLYTVLVANFTNFDDAIAQSYLKLSLTGFVSVGITALVQWYFAFRLYKLSNNKPIPLIAAAFSLMRLICFIGAGSYRQKHHSQTEDWTRGLFAVGILSIMSDILMAVKLSICLWKRREGGGKKFSFRNPFKTVDDIILISIQANMGTCIVTTITVILYNVSKNGFAWMAMTLVASRLFAISFLSSLISGKKLCPQTVPAVSSLRLSDTFSNDVLSNASPTILLTERSFGDTEPMSSLESAESGVSPLRTSSLFSLPEIRSEKSSSSCPV